MSAIEELLPESPFSLSKSEKWELYTNELERLTLNAYENCAEYRKILDIMGFDPRGEHFLGKSLYQARYYYIWGVLAIT